MYLPVVVYVQEFMSSSLSVSDGEVVSSGPKCVDHNCINLVCDSTWNPRH